MSAPVDSLPLVGRLPLHPSLAVQASAFVADQLSVVEPPFATVELAARNEIAGAEESGGVTGGDSPVS